MIMGRFSSQSAFLSLLLPFAILCNLGVCELKASYNEKDKQILLCFKHGLTDSSNMLSTWSNKKDCCEWRGIQCNINGRVTTISLPCSTDDSVHGINKNKTHCLAGRYKYRLRQVALKSAMGVPMYQTLNVGPPHAPKFRSTVLVDGMSFPSELTFTQPKAAEQESARLALECLNKKIKEEVYSFIRENATLCKSILNDYAAKWTIAKPTFNTVRQEGVVPVFVSSLVFNGTSYTGDAAKSKKEAEQLVARAVVLSILGNPDSGMIIFQNMINSKSKFYDTTNTKGLQPIYASGVSSIANTADSSVVMDHKDKEVVDPVVKDHNDKKVADPVGEDHKDIKIADPVGKDHNDKKVADSVGEDHKAKEVVDLVSYTNNAMLSTCQQSQMPRQEPTPEATKSPNGSQQPGNTLPTEDGSSSKKRRKLIRRRGGNLSYKLLEFL